MSLERPTLDSARDDVPIRGDSAARRLVDVVVSAGGLAVASPLLVLVAAIVKAESRGPVFYMQERIGKHGQPFRIVKFRSMVADAERIGPLVSGSRDPRITRVGAFLRATKLDELPQLINVFKGDMSLVGPRPEDPEFVELCRVDFATILTVRPGITGLSQLAFAKESELLDPARRIEDYVGRFLPQKIALDRAYVARRTLALDLKILAWTAAAVIVRQDVAVNRKTAALTARRRPARGELGTAPVAQ
jgi:lipopolysaccharide/colanic/teichoic acid biosynthesis glycosyltransferase